MTINPAQLDLELAKKRLEGIIKRELTFRESAVQQHSEILSQEIPCLSPQHIEEVTQSLFYLRKDMPEIISVGTSQLVFQLDGGYVGKTSWRQSQDGPLPKDYYAVNDGKAYSARNEITAERLIDLGFEIPKHHYFGVKQHDGRIELEESGYGKDFVITRDLSEGGKFKIEDVEDRHFRQLINGEDIRRQLNAHLEVLRNAYGGNHLRYKLEVNGHISNDDPDKALRRLFFVVTNPATNIGSLVVGDIDHIGVDLKT